MDASALLSSALGIRLTLWLGKAVAVPAPIFVVEALSAAEVTLSDQGQDGFQLTFTVGRAGVGMLDNLLAASPLLLPFNRVILQIWFGVFPEILIDGIITRQDFHASGEPGTSLLTITGEDIRVLMDMDETAMSYPNQPPNVRIQTLLIKYSAYLGMPPMITPAVVPDTYLMTDRIPLQSCTDLEYINALAKKNNYVFFVEPQSPMVNLAFWGPDKSLPFPDQSALSVNMGPDSNVDSIQFSNDALSPRMVSGFIQDKALGVPMPVASLPIARPPLTPLPAVITQQPNVRRVLPKHSGSIDVMEAILQAQAVTNQHNDAVTATGELDAVRYGHVLKARRFVGVRGAGLLQDGKYYVKQVKHTIKHGEYKQSFILKRDGRGPILPGVIP